MLGPIELVLSGVTEALLSAHTRAHDPEAVELVRDSLRHANRRMLRNAVVSISLSPGRPDRSAAQIAAPTLMITGSDHSGFTPAQLRPPPASPDRPIRCRARRRLPGAARGADDHIDAHPRVLGTVRG